MRRIEDLRQLHPNRRQIIDIKKSPIINFLGGDAPECESIRLRVQQLIERVETAWIAGLAINGRKRPFDAALHLRRFLTSAFQASFDDLFFAGSFRHSFRIGFCAAREVLQRGQDALEFRVKLFLLVLA